MLEDVSDDGPLFDESNDLHLISAAGTPKRVHLINLLQESGPTAAPLPGKMLGGRVRLWCRVQSRVQGRRDGLLSPLAARGIRVTAVVTDHLLMGVGDVGGHQGNPVQRIHPSGQTLPGAVVDLPGFSLVLESSPGETGTQDIGGQPFQSGLIVSINRGTAVHLEAGRVPAAEPIGELPAEAALAGQHLQDVVLEKAREPLIVEWTERMEWPLLIPGAIAEQRVKVGVKVELIAVSLDSEDGSGSSCRVGEVSLTKNTN